MSQQQLSGMLVACAIAVTATQARAETFTANAAVKMANGAQAAAPLTATVRAFASDADRDALLGAIKKGGTAARDLLAKRASAGAIEVGGKTTPIKYAYAHPSGSGRIITIVTAEPIHFVVGPHPDTKVQAGHDLGIVLIDLSGKPAHGEVALAAKVHVDAQGAIVIDDYGDEVVRLTDVVSK